MTSVDERPEIASSSGERRDEQAGITRARTLYAPMDDFIAPTFSGGGHEHNTEIRCGLVAKLADDLYCGGHTPDELLENWTKVLVALHKNNSRLSVSKTIINPKCTTMIGWIWSQGTLTATPS